MRRTSEEIIEFIEDFLNGRGGLYDWDDFLSIKIADPELNRFRLQCVKLREKYPPGPEGGYCGEEGLRWLREVVADLKR